jgi:hypothetical protein
MRDHDRVFNTFRDGFHRDLTKIFGSPVKILAPEICVEKHEQRSRTDARSPSVRDRGFAGSEF